MKPGRLSAALLAAILAACSTLLPRSEEPSFYVMRHLHKAAGADPGLTEEGMRCADRLADLLARRGIGAVYASTTNRARDTAAPLAARLAIGVDEYDPRDTAGLVARVRAEPGSVLVVGHSNTVPDIVEGLGGARPEALAEDRYGEVWRVSRASGTMAHSRIEGC